MIAAGLGILARRFDAAAQEMAPIFVSPRGLAAALGLYLLALFLLRGLLFPAASGDDAEQLLLAQSLEPGYMVRNPPLYSWLMNGAVRILGVSATTAVAVRFLLLAFAYLCLYRAAALVLGEGRLAALAALSPVALYFVGWHLVRSNTNSVLLVAMCAATLYALLALERTGRTGWYLALGGAVGLGLLSKYNYGIFALALLTAALLEPAMRRRLADRRTLIAATLAVAVFAPYGIWLLGELDQLGGSARTRFVMAEGGWWAALRPLVEVPRSLLGFLMPLILILAAFLWPAFRRLPGEALAEAPSARHRRMLGRFLLIQLALVAVLALATGAGRVPNKYLLIFTPFPIWFFARVEAARVAEIALDRVGAALAAVALVIPVVLVGKLLIDPLHCRVCYFHVDYGALAADLRANGFEGGTVVAHYYPYMISGNLRRFFPDSRFVSTKHPDFVPPERAAPGQCLVIWSAETEAGMEASMVGWTQGLFGFGAEVESLRREAVVPIRYGWGRTTRFTYRLFPNGAGRCR